MLQNMHKVAHYRVCWKPLNGEGYMKYVAARIWSCNVQRESFHTLRAMINPETHWCLLKVTNPSGCQEKTQCFSAAAQTKNQHLMKQKKHQTLQRRSFSWEAWGHPYIFKRIWIIYLTCAPECWKLLLVHHLRYIISTHPSTLHSEMKV